jgi:hypothetical protein
MIVQLSRHKRQVLFYRKMIKTQIPGKLLNQRIPNIKEAAPRAAVDESQLCRRWESNPHTRRYTILSRARLPIPPLRLDESKYIENAHMGQAQDKLFFVKLSCWRQMK